MYFWRVERVLWGWNPGGMPARPVRICGGWSTPSAQSARVACMYVCIPAVLLDAGAAGRGSAAGSLISASATNEHICTYKPHHIIVSLHCFPRTGILGTSTYDPSRHPTPTLSNDISPILKIQ